MRGNLLLPSVHNVKQRVLRIQNSQPTCLVHFLVAAADVHKTIVIDGQAGHSVDAFLLVLHLDGED